MSADLQSDVLVRAWEPNLREEGARFSAMTERRDITFQARLAPFEVEKITRPGLVVIAASAAPNGQNAVDVCAGAIAHQIKFTILGTDELIWIPLAANRDGLDQWHFECVPFVEWLRIVLRNEPELKGTPHGR